MEKVAAKYRDCKFLDKAIEAAKLQPSLQILVKQYEKTGNAACFNAIMCSAGIDVWTAYYTGKIVNS